MGYAIGLVHEEDGVFGISFPDFPGCISTADTFDEVVERGAQALHFHVEGMVEDGEAIPVTRSMSMIRKDPEVTDDLRADATLVAIPVDLPGRKVRINLSLDENLLATLDRVARATGSSRSGFVAEAVRARIAGKDAA